MQAQIISIGTELTAGLTVDTNAAWLAKRLAAHGIVADRHVTVPDDRGAIRDAITAASALADIVIITGGLGPTADDLTREALADAARRPLVLNPQSLDKITAYFEQIQRDMPETNRRQACLPEGADPLDNPCGTAPGIRLRLGRATVFALPGVPSEMRAMFVEEVRPELTRQSSEPALITRTLRCFGGSESRIGETVEDLMAPGREAVVGITAKGAIISLRVTARDATVVGDTMVVLRDRLGTLVFGEEDETLESAVATLLIQQGRTVATAESCTGGLLAEKLTDVPGSSAYFLGGFVTYANEAKTAQLGVSPDVISTHGAVSEEVARIMASACRERLSADFGLATTGIAGPSGGTPEKPVGLVHIALATASETQTRRLLIKPELGRSAIRNRTCNGSLNLLRRRLIAPLAE